MLGATAAGAAAVGERILRAPDRIHYKTLEAVKKGYALRGLDEARPYESLIEASEKFYTSIQNGPFRKVLDAGGDDGIFELLRRIPAASRIMLKGSPLDIGPADFPSVGTVQGLVGSYDDYSFDDDSSIDSADSSQPRTVEPFPLNLKSLDDIMREGLVPSANGFFTGPTTFITNWHVLKSTLEEYAQSNPSKREDTLELIQKYDAFYAEKRIDIIWIEITKSEHIPPIVRQGGKQFGFSEKSPEQMDGSLVQLRAIDKDTNADPTTGIKLETSCMVLISEQLADFIVRHDPVLRAYPILHDAWKKRLVGDFLLISTPGEEIKTPSTPRNVLGLRILDWVRGLKPDLLVYGRGKSGAPAFDMEGKVAGVMYQGGTIEYNGETIEYSLLHGVGRIHEAQRAGMAFEWK